MITQDWTQLLEQEQANSVEGTVRARIDPRFFNALRTVSPHLVHPDTAVGPFKLVLESFGLSNIMVKSEDNLTIVGLFDLEWTYSGPPQMAASPWWLLDERLNLYDIGGDGGPEGLSAITERYFEHLEIYKRVLKEEERTMPGLHDRTMSSLIDWSEKTKALWFHMVLHTGFNYPSSISIIDWGEGTGEEWLDRWDYTFPLDMEASVAQKNGQLDEYNRAKVEFKLTMLSLDAKKTREDVIMEGVKRLVANWDAKRRRRKNAMRREAE